MTVDAPVLAARATDGEAALRVTTGDLVVRLAQDAGAVGTVEVAPDLLLDHRLEPIEERALHGVAHYAAAPFGDLSRVTAGAIRRLRVVRRQRLEAIDFVAGFGGLLGRLELN